MMCGHADAMDGWDERVLSDAGILGYDLVQHGGDRLLTNRREEDVAVVEGLHRFVAGATRREEHNGGGQVLVAESDNQINRMNRGRHAISFPLQSRPSRTR